MNFLVDFQQARLTSEAYTNSINNNSRYYVQEEHVNTIHEGRFVCAEAQIPNGARKWIFETIFDI